MVSLRGLVDFEPNYFFCLQERDFGSKKEIPFTPYQFRIFLVASPILGYASTINDGLWRSLVLFKWCLGKVFYCWVGSRDLFRFISMFFSRIFNSLSFFGRKFGFPKSRDELGSSYSATNILSEVPTECNMPRDLTPATPGTLIIAYTVWAILYRLK